MHTSIHAYIHTHTYRSCGGGGVPPPVACGGGGAGGGGGGGGICLYGVYG